MSDKVWKENDKNQPKFPNDWDIIKKSVLQVTDIKTNRNKYYAIELHSAKNKFRVFTHYGRTDDLDSNPDAGVREVRYCDSLHEAESLYDKIYREKTSIRKGYKEINLASSKIGSKKSVGQSCGTIDDKTLKKLNDKTASNKTVTTCLLSNKVQDFVKFIYKEATGALTNTINASITANGIETPLGVLTLGQIDKGQTILDELYVLYNKKTKTKKVKDDIIALSGEFYTAIPHRFGRSRSSANEAVIDELHKINEKQDTLQLMRDMLNVNGDSSVLVNPEINKKYDALNCDIQYLESKSDKFKEITEYINTHDGKKLKIKNIFSVKRDCEQKEFDSKVGNNQLLFHGSATKNWVGILSRGLLLPKIVVTLGVHRTDAGWLGNGIYFGDSILTSYNYAGYSSNTRIITIAEVALGKIKNYHKITYGLQAPPKGFDSCHGVKGSEFSDDEFVIYKHNQQKLSYIIEL